MNIKTHIDIMNLWESDTALSGAVNEPLGTIRVWRHRKAIPATKHIKVCVAARKAGFDLEPEQFLSDAA